jgi:hypothetical protein
MLATNSLCLARNVKVTSRKRLTSLWANTLQAPKKKKTLFKTPDEFANVYFASVAIALLLVCFNKSSYTLRSEC